MIVSALGAATAVIDPHLLLIYGYEGYHSNDLLIGPFWAVQSSTVPVMITPGQAFIVISIAAGVLSTFPTSARRVSYRCAR